jgi:hypothetical protein
MSKKTEIELDEVKKYNYFSTHKFEQICHIHTTITDMAIKKRSKMKLRDQYCLLLYALQLRF